MANEDIVREFYREDFIPQQGLSAESRQVNALEYLAHQMGLIRKELEALNETLKRQGA